MYTYWKIERYAFDENSGTHSSTVTSTLSGFHDPIVRTRLGSGRDTFEFKYLNNNGNFDSAFNIGDKLVIYYTTNTTTVTGTDILMTGVVNDLPFSDSAKNVQKIAGNNYSETLMNAITFTDGTSVTVPNFIQNALSAVNAFNNTFGITWNSSNPSLKTDGTAFPNGERWYNKSMLQLLERYSSRSFNQDRNYYWYVDQNNELIWRPQTGNAVASFDSSSDNYVMMRSKKDTKDITNFVIIKGDTSPSGKVIQTRVDNAASRVKNGFKPRIITSVANYGKELVETDRAAFPGSFDEGDTNPNTYNFTTAWTAKVARASNPSMVVGSTVTVSSDKEYNIAIETQAKYELKLEAERFLDVRGEGKIQLEITFKPGETPSGSIWRIGDIINVTVAEIGKTNDPMRVESAEYSNTTERYVLIEDEGSI